MADPETLAGLEREHRALLERFTYFLLATDLLSNGFVFWLLKGEPLSWVTLPAAGAILLWSASFLMGWGTLTNLQSVLQARSQLLRLRSAPLEGSSDGSRVGAVIQGARYAKELKEKNFLAEGTSAGESVFCLLAFLFFVGWRLLLALTTAST